MSPEEHLTWCQSAAARLSGGQAREILGLVERGKIHFPHSVLQEIVLKAGTDLSEDLRTSTDTSEKMVPPGVAYLAPEERKRLEEQAVKEDIPF